MYVVYVYAVLCKNVCGADVSCLCECVNVCVMVEICRVSLYMWNGKKKKTVGWDKGKHWEGIREKEENCGMG